MSSALTACGVAVVVRPPLPLRRRQRRALAPPRRIRRTTTLALLGSSGSALDQLSSSTTVLPETVRRRRSENEATASSASSSNDEQEQQLVASLASQGRELWDHERDRILSGCEPVYKTNRKLKIALLMSGGVDSSVALFLLRAAGHDVYPFYLKIWFEEDFRNSWSACPWEEDVDAAEAAIEAIFGKWGEDENTLSSLSSSPPLPPRPPKLTLVPLTTHYWRRVVDSAVEDLRKGRTPNPDMMCNSRVKFGAFVEMLRAGEVAVVEGEGRDNDGSRSGGGLVGGGFDRVASGHYASLLRGAGGETTRRSGSSSSSGGNDNRDNGSGVGEDGTISPPPSLLGVAADANKDQTYFLARLSHEQLRAACFPLGPLQKPEVRALAAFARLPNASRKDSQGLCFLGKVRFDEFVAAHLGKWPGPLIEEEHEEEVYVEEEEVERDDEGARPRTKTVVVPPSVAGFHDGAWFFTPGQRKGIGLSGGPWFVTRKDMRTNAVFVSRSYRDVGPRRRTSEDGNGDDDENDAGESDDDTRKRFVVGSLAWLPGGSALEALEASKEQRLRVKVRHGPSSYLCGLELLRDGGVDGGDNFCSSSSPSSSSSAPALRARVTLDRPDQGLAPGQFAVFYDGGVCVGSGVIEASGGGGSEG